MAGPWEKYQSAGKPWERYAQAENPSRNNVPSEQDPSREDQPSLSRRLATSIAHGIVNPAIQFIGHQAQLAQRVQDRLGLGGAAPNDPRYGSQLVYNLPEKLGGKIEVDAPASGKQAARQLVGEGLQTALLGIPGQALEGMSATKGGTLIGSMFGLGNAIESAQSPSQAALDIGGGALGGAILGKGTEIIGSVVKPKTIESVVGDKFTKAIRPTVVGKSTATQIENYNQRSVDAVKSIIENKPNLELLDHNGELTGKLPQNLQQFSQAIEQTKGQIFKQYDAMQEAAGRAGAKVELAPIVSELNKVADDAVVKDLHPEIAKYAQEMANRFGERAEYSTKDAQTAIASLNNKLESFYKNPSYENASKVSVDAMVVNRLRAGLDDSISSITEPGYQALKNKYGSLSAIEKDVTHRAIVDARRNAKGLIDFTDVFSASDVAKGLIKHDPSMIAAGVAKKGISAYIKMRNDPNRIVRQMFQQAESVPIVASP